MACEHKEQTYNGEKKTTVRITRRAKKPIAQQNVHEVKLHAKEKAGEARAASLGTL